MAYDLHVHSTASDGVYTATEIVNMADQLGLAGLALTDHDTVDGLEEFLQAGQAVGMDVLPGIEINTDYGEREVHILGYGINYQDQALIAALAEIKQARLGRGLKMVEKLESLGLPIAWEEVTTLAAGGVVGRPHIAMAMINHGYVQTVSGAFTYYLSRGKPAYVPRYKLTPAQAVDIIQKAGGCAVLAHPGLIKDETLTKEVARMVNGIEVYYPEHSQKETEMWEQYALAQGLLITGGSDFHGLEGNKGCLGKRTASDEQVSIMKGFLIK